MTTETLLQAAETIEQLNARDGMGINCAVSPKWLREEAARMEAGK